MIGKSVNEISFYLYQNGAGSASETLSFGVWDSSGNLKGSVFGTTPVSTLNSGTLHTDKVKVTQTGTGVTIAAGDTIGGRINQASTGYTIYFATQNSDGYSNADRSIFNEGSTPTTYSRDVNFEAGYSGGPVSATSATSLGSNTLMVTTDTHTQSQVNDWGPGAGGGKGTTGQYIATTNSVLYNQPIYEVSLWCYATGSPTGDFRIGVWNDGGLSSGGTDVGTLIHTFGIIDASTIAGTSSNPVKLTATGTTAYKPQVTDLIGYYQTSGFTDSSNTINCGQQNTQVFDSSDSHLTEGFNSNTVFQTRDHTIEFKIGSPPDYTTNLSGSLDEFFINSDALTQTEITNISTRGIDAWSILPNPNDYPLSQTELPNNSIVEGTSTVTSYDINNADTQQETRSGSTTSNGVQILSGNSAIGHSLSEIMFPLKKIRKST